MVLKNIFTYFQKKDEIDAIAGIRGGEYGSSNCVTDRIVSQLLVEWDGIESLSNVTVIAATNRPDLIDKALLRPSRIDRILYIELPDFEARKEIFEIFLKKNNYFTQNISKDDFTDINELAKLTEGYSGAEISFIYREAVLKALEEDIHISYIKKKHFLTIINTIKPTITFEIIQFYKNWKNLCGIQSI